MHAMLAKWIPPLEMSKFGAYVYAGKNLNNWLKIAERIII